MTKCKQGSMLQVPRVNAVMMSGHSLLGNFDPYFKYHSIYYHRELLLLHLYRRLLLHCYHAGMADTTSTRMFTIKNTPLTDTIQK